MHEISNIVSAMYLFAALLIHAMQFSRPIAVFACGESLERGKRSLRFLAAENPEIRYFYPARSSFFVVSGSTDLRFDSRRNVHLPPTT